VIFFSVIFILIGGGEGVMIPESAWGLLMGALTMIGSAFAAALCIMAGVKAGGEMLVEKPELSIWALLFVALGEGLAIYGLIVAILLIG
jgi:V/A-type H+-transporting ATPase subunit K